MICSYGLAVQFGRHQDDGIKAVLAMTGPAHIDGNDPGDFIIDGLINRFRVVVRSSKREAIQRKSLH